jgi:hypothetical protein
VETVACQHLINRRNYLSDPAPLRKAYRFSEKLFAKLQVFRGALHSSSVREESSEYQVDSSTPF